MLIRSTGRILVVVVVVVVDSCSLHNVCLFGIEIHRNMSIRMSINMNWSHFGLCVPER